MTAQEPPEAPDVSSPLPCIVGPAGIPRGQPRRVRRRGGGRATPTSTQGRS